MSTEPLADARVVPFRTHNRTITETAVSPADTYRERVR